MKNFIVEKSMIYGSIYEREIGFEKGLLEVNPNATLLTQYA